MNISTIIRSFNKVYPTLNPKIIYKMNGGYLIIAPDTDGEVDCNDPNYYMPNDLSTAKPFDMKNMKEFFKIISTTPIWKN